METVQTPAERTLESITEHETLTVLKARHIVAGAYGGALAEVPKERSVALASVLGLFGDADEIKDVFLSPSSDAILDNIEKAYRRANHNQLEMLVKNREYDQKWLQQKINGPNAGANFFYPTWIAIISDLKTNSWETAVVSAARKLCQQEGEKEARSELIKGNLDESLVNLATNEIVGAMIVATTHYAAHMK
jgi:hypothetical protein